MPRAENAATSKQATRSPLPSSTLETAFEPAALQAAKVSTRTVAVPVGAEKGRKRQRLVRADAEGPDSSYITLRYVIVTFVP
jgi:hypothetical protein